MKIRLLGLIAGLAMSLANPVLAAGDHADLATCQKLVHDKYFIKDGRALNNGLGHLVKRCMKHGPSSI